MSTDHTEHTLPERDELSLVTVLRRERDRLITEGKYKPHFHATQTADPAHDLPGDDWFEYAE